MAGSRVPDCSPGWALRRLPLNLLALTALALLASPTAQATTPGRNGEIIFNTYRTGDHVVSTIWAMNADGSNQHQLITPLTGCLCGDGSDFQPAISPDGSMLAFIRTGDGYQHVWIANINGSAAYPLDVNPCEQDSGVSWSPDGTELVISANFNCGPYYNNPTPLQIWKLDGSAPPQPVPNSNGFGCPAWSPDGQWIEGCTQNGIEIIHPDGTNRTRLTPGGTLSEVRGGSWSPDGQTIAFSATLTSQPGEYNVWTVDVDGSGLTQLTNDTLDQYGTFELATWSPDGQKILYLRRGYPGLSVMNADGTDPVQLTNDINDGFGDWQTLPQRADQTISFPSLSATFGQADLDPGATASSGLPVSYSTSTPDVCLIASGLLHIVSAGSCDIIATQPGNESFNPAQPVEQVFTVAKAATSTTLTGSQNPSILDSPVSFTASVTSQAGTPDGSIQFQVDGQNIGAPIALVGGVATLSGQVLPAGPHTILAVYLGSANYAPSSTTLSEQVTPPAVFAYNSACGSGNGLLINGSKISIAAGGVHSNGSLLVNGSTNTFSGGSFGGPNACKGTVNGSGDTFGGNPTPTVDPALEAWPNDYSQATIPCTYSAANYTFNTSNSTIPPGVYCATGTVTLNGNNLTGNITMSAQKITVNGSGENLTPYTQGLLLYQKGNGTMTLNGSGDNLSGAVFAPTATITLTGSSTQHITGSIEGLNVTLTGNNWSMT